MGLKKGKAELSVNKTKATGTQVEKFLSFVPVGSDLFLKLIVIDVSLLSPIVLIGMLMARAEKEEDYKFLSWNNQHNTEATKFLQKEVTLYHQIICITKEYCGRR